MIGVEGALALRQALKTNTTLKTLHLESVPQKQNTFKQCEPKRKQNTDNELYDDGVFALSDALKVNTTLEKLYLEGVPKFKIFSKYV